VHTHVFDLITTVGGAGYRIVTVAWRPGLAGAQMTGFITVAEQLVGTGRPVRQILMHARAFHTCISGADVPIVAVFVRYALGYVARPGIAGDTVPDVVAGRRINVAEGTRDHDALVEAASIVTAGTACGILAAVG
jgi:hypothetical protein